MAMDIPAEHAGHLQVLYNLLKVLYNLLKVLYNLL